jgi:hypothetical protein
MTKPLVFYGHLVGSPASTLHAESKESQSRAGYKNESHVRATILQTIPLVGIPFQSGHNR